MAPPLLPNPSGKKEERRSGAMKSPFCLSLSVVGVYTVYIVVHKLDLQPR